MKILRTSSPECFNQMPLKVSWFLTAKCNYRCSYCFYHGKGKHTPPQLPFFTLEQAKVAVNNVVSLNRPWYDLQFIGGEPTVYPHITELISMFQERLGERINCILITTNGSRNMKLYQKILEFAKLVRFQLNISIHTDHVDMPHILELIENLSKDTVLQFELMFNPDKREMVYEIYDTLCEYRKKYWFNMNVVMLRDGDRVDPRYTPEDFAWQKKAMKQFNELVKSVASDFPPRKKVKHPKTVFRDIEDNGKVKTVKAGNRNLELIDGLLQYKGMYCIAFANILRIQDDGRCRGIICGDDPFIGNIFEENFITNVRDKLVHAVRCTHNICGCIGNDSVPKFASEEDAKKYVEFAQKRQAELCAEYDATHSERKL